MSTAARYVRWLERYSLAIVAGSGALFALAVYLIAFHLPLLADFSYLLPQDSAAVRDLRRIEARVRSSDTLLVVIQATTSSEREAAVRMMDAGIRALPRDLVEHVESDDGEIRDFLRAHRHLFVPLPDLIEARDALSAAIKRAKIDANPLFVDLEDRPPAGRADPRLEELREKRRRAELRLARSGHVSADGTIATIDVQVAFSSTDVDRDHALIAELEAIRARVIAAHPGVTMGFAGAIMTTIVEQGAITRGMLLSSIVTAALVALVLALYFRSARLLAMLLATLVIATTAAFGAAVFTVGHLNAATAFLGAIIAGNGVNYGILLIARYLEESRGGGADREGALARAIAGTLRPTLVASLGAAIAYGSLVATSFRGFADFAVMGAIGMLLCWIASYVLLPALVLRHGARAARRTGDLWIGAALVRVLGFRRPGVVRVVSLVVAIAAGAITVQYVRDDPFEYDMKRLRSEGDDAETARRWMKLSDDTFGRSFAGPIYIAADRPDQVPHIVRALEARDPEHRVIGPVRSILDAIPERQEEKLAVLTEIRTMLDRELDALDDKERAELLAVRPPDELAPITASRLPPSLRDRLIEKDGRVGLLIAVQTAMQPDEWSGHELIRFATAVRRIELPGDEVVTTSGPSVVFADIVETVAHDGPIVTLVAVCCLFVMVVVLVGWNRRALAVLAATGAGSLLMVAACALAGIKVNFLDFVALPITLGLGVDYAINIAHRHTGDRPLDPIEALRTSGAAVFMCSVTTIIGYGSLLVSDNLAIRGFGLASLIGEITCLLTALILVPAMLARRVVLVLTRRV